MDIFRGQYFSKSNKGGGKGKATAPLDQVVADLKSKIYKAGWVRLDYNCMLLQTSSQTGPSESVLKLT